MLFGKDQLESLCILFPLGDVSISFVLPADQRHSYSKAHVCLLFPASPFPGQDCHLLRGCTRRAHVQRAQSESLARPSSEVFGYLKP